MATHWSVRADSPEELEPWTKRFAEAMGEGDCEIRPLFEATDFISEDYTAEDAVREEALRRQIQEQQQQ